MKDLDARLRKAVQHFWATREGQSNRQGGVSGVRDQGARAAVTGGKHLDGFVTLVQELLIEGGLPSASVFARDKRVLPGFYRATKDWDLVVVHKQVLIAGLEFKAQVGPSFGNNFNNRVEEALGNAIDLRTAFREGAFRPSTRPWMGYLMLLEECDKSTQPVSIAEPHFPVLPEFRNASYARRYELFCEKLVRESMYTAACFLLSPTNGGQCGLYSEPNPELSFRHFAVSLVGHASAVEMLGGDWQPRTY